MSKTVYLILYCTTIITNCLASITDYHQPLTYYEYFNPVPLFRPHDHDNSKIKITNLDCNQEHKLKVNLFNRTVLLHLQPNNELIQKDAQLRLNGFEYSLDRAHYLVYHGKVFDLKDTQDEDPIEKGTLSMTMQHDSLGDATYQGMFTYNQEIFNVQSVETFNLIRKSYDPRIQRRSIYQESETIVYRSQDIQPRVKLENHDHAECGLKSNHNFKNNFNSELSSSLVRRQVDGVCNQKLKVLYMGVAADCNYIARYKTVDAARLQIIKDFNTVSELYSKHFNIKLGIIKIEIVSDSCPSTPDPKAIWNRKCDTGYDMKRRLDDFSSWRATKGADSTGLWHLMTDCVSGPQVGLGYVGTLCQSAKGGSKGPQGDTGTAVSAATKDTWKVIAHEIGHNFGAIHDCTSSSCPCSGATCGDCCPCDDKCSCDGKYLMNPESTSSSAEFSPCSKRRMCEVINSSGSCLAASDTIPTYSEAMCGNGIKEKGEDCDCGGEEGCKNNPCCEAKTCKFKDGAQCDLNDGCCDKCKVRPAGILCRAKSGECDLEEKCDGNSGLCPVDKFLPNGTPCNSTTGSTPLKCANGLCTSRDLQCQLRSKGSNKPLFKACDASGSGDPCQMLCASPDGAFSCYGLGGAFNDGTECGRNRYCDAGICSGGNAFDVILSWIENNKLFAIIFGVALGLIIISCCCTCFSRGKRKLVQRKTRTVPANLPSYPLHGLNSPTSRPTFVDPTIYNGPIPPYSQLNSHPTYNGYPPPPNPSFRP